MHFRAAAEMWSDKIRLLMVASRRMDGRAFSVVKPLLLEVVEVQDGMPIMDATLDLDREAAQSLMDELWSVGLRPAEGKYPQEHVNAMKAHLEDMRKLVFSPNRTVP